jgi:hypothetical protein
VTPLEGAWIYPDEVKCWVEGIGWFNYVTHVKLGDSCLISFETKKLKHFVVEAIVEYIFRDELLEDGYISGMELHPTFAFRRPRD